VNGRYSWLAGCWLLATQGLWACGWQSDLVAQLRPVNVGCDGAADGCMPCSTAESCASDPACADAAVCKPPPDRPDAGPDAAPVATECRDRLCDNAPTQSAFCSQDGSLLVLGDSCSSETSNPQFRFVLCSRDELVTAGPLHAVGDIAVDGTHANFGAETSIDGALLYSGVPPTCTCSTIGATPIAAPPSCARAADSLLDIAQTVRERATDNDNASATDALGRLSNATTDVTVTLPCGRYYVPAIEGTGRVTVHALGNLALFVDGRVRLDHGFSVDAPPGARITLVVNGAFYVIGGFQLGDASAARHVLAVAAQLFLQGGDNVIGGTLYVPNDQLLLTTGQLTLHGAAFVHNANLGGATELQYAQDPGLAAQSCDAP